jgi:hypothetical protein
MCFDQKSAFGFAALGFFAAWWIHHKTNNSDLAAGVFFFFTMEFLQGLQYFVIADDLDHHMCADKINQFLTMLGYLHICLQPYYCHLINSSLTNSEKYKLKYSVIKRLSLIGGFLLFARFLIAGFPGMSTMDVSFNKETGTGASTEWLRGEKLCTFNGKYHLAWAVPMADPTYYVQGAGIHSFLMFAPFFALYEKKGMIIQGAFLFLTGPGLAAFITPNLMEQASIWCFFSIAQICIMLFGIRETLVIHWGREDARRSLYAAKPDLKKKVDKRAAEIEAKKAK